MQGFRPEAGVRAPVRAPVPSTSELEAGTFVARSTGLGVEPVQRFGLTTALQRAWLVHGRAIHQLDPISVLRNFESVAHTVEHNVGTDIPLNRLLRLVRLGTAVDPRDTVTVTFGRDYILRRRKTDNFPLPNVRPIRATVREAPLNPREARADGRIELARASC